MSNSESFRVSPDLERYAAEIGEGVKLGEALTILGHPFAEPINNEALINLALSHGLSEAEIESAQRVITTTGFTNRYFSNPKSEEISPEKITDRASDVGAILLKKIIKSKGWEDGIDVFIDTSAFLPESINEQVLIKAGISPDKVIKKSYRYACAGAVSAFIDTISDPNLKHARVVIAALEPLSQLLSPTHFSSPETISIPSIFGDGNTLIAFEPKYFQLDSKKVLIQPDGGVIKIKTLYDFDESNKNDLKTPSHYSFENGGENIFRFDKSGAFLNITKPTGSAISMDGKGTGFFFADKTSNVIEDLLKQYGDLNLFRKMNGKNLILHPASKPVVDRIAKLLWRAPRNYLDEPKLQFLMDKARQSNTSSATTLNRWAYMIQNDLIDPTLPMLWIAPGIGSAIAGAIGRVNKF